MKDSTEFDDEDKRESESNWHLGISSTPSFDTIASRAGLQQHNLRIMFKVHVKGILMTQGYYKLDEYFKHENAWTYLWIYISNVLCKSLPSTYVYIFLSSYAAEDHLFISKMVPIFYGYIWYSMFAGFFGIINFCGYIGMLWDYIITGLLYKNPWNRCAPKYDFSMNMTCYDVTEFTEKIQNETLSFQIHGYIIQSNPNELFQMAPLMFLKIINLVLYELKSF